MIVKLKLFSKKIIKFAAPPPGPTTSTAVGAAGAASSSVAASSSLGIVPSQQTHTPPQPPDLPGIYQKILTNNK